MTEFKRKKYLSSLFGNYLEIKGIVGLEDGFELHLFEERIQVNAMTEYDRDYRKEWSWGTLVYEGNNYGDTSDFYVPGIIRRTNEMIKRDLDIFSDKKRLLGRKVYLAEHGEGTITAVYDSVIKVDSYPY